MSYTRQSQVHRFSECPCSGVNLDKLVHPALLTALCAGELHGYRLMETIAEFPTFEGKPPDSAYIYRLLRSLEKKGFVVGSWDTSRYGPAKRLYRITPAGHQCLMSWVEVLTRYQAAIGGLVRKAKRTACTKRKCTSKG